MSDGSLFDLFIQGTSNGGDFNRGKQTVSHTSPKNTEVYRNLDFYFLSLLASLFSCGKRKEIMLARSDVFIRDFFIFLLAYYCSCIN